MKKVYFDYSATTPVKNEVLEYIKDYFNVIYGNPSSTHSFGVQAKNAIVNARSIIAKCINASANEIYFTSGGTESDNWALKGVAEAYKDKGNHIITTSIEHPAVLNTAKKLEKMGYNVTYLDVDEYGLINIEDLKKSIKDNTILVSIMFINNEIGTIQDIESIGNICREKNIVFHSDAVQAFSNIAIDVKKLPVDLLSISSHKFYGLKGTGVLFIKNGIKIASLIDGGSQEKTKRAGTENVVGILAMAKAAQLACDNLEQHIEKLTELREYTLNRIMNEIDEVKYNGHPQFRHPANLHFSFKAMNSTALLIALDSLGIAVSAGSACSSGSLKASHVLKSIGVEDEYALGSIRISMGDYTTKSDCDYLVESLKKVCQKNTKR